MKVMPIELLWAGKPESREGIDSQGNHVWKWFQSFAIVVPKSTKVLHLDGAQHSLDELDCVEGDSEILVLFRAFDLHPYGDRIPNITVPDPAVESVSAEVNPWNLNGAEVTFTSGHLKGKTYTLGKSKTYSGEWKGGAAGLVGG